MAQGGNSFKISDFKLSQQPGSKYEVVNNQHAIVGATVDVSFDINVEKETELKKYEYEIKKGGSIISDNSDSFSPAIGQNQTVTYSALFKCFTRDNASAEWVRDESLDETKSVETDKFSIYATPVNPTTSDKDYSTYVGSDAKSLSFTYNPNSGNPNGWNIQWYVNEKLVSGEKNASLIFNPESAGNYKIKVTCKNLAPDNSTLWMEEWSKDWTVNVYGTPKVDVQWPSNYEILEGNNVGMTLKREGGYENGWTIRWTQTNGNGTLLGSTSNSATYTSVNSDCGKNVQLALNITNKSPEGEVWYNETINAPKTLEVYNKPAVKQIDKHYAPAKKKDNVYAIFSGEAFDLSELFEFTGGFDTSYGHKTGWNVQYKVNNSSLESSIFDINNVGDYTIDINLTNTATLTDGTHPVWKSESMKYTFSVLPNPDTKVTIDGYDAENQSNWNILNGDQPKIEIVKVNGPEAWIFKWTNNGVVYQEGTSNQYQFDAVITGEKEPEHINIKVDISNIPDNIVKPKVMPTTELNFVVWSEPSMVNDDLKNGNMTLETFSGRPEIITMFRVGGYESNWRDVQWKPIDKAPAGIQHEEPTRHEYYTYEFENGFGEVNQKTTYKYELCWTFVDRNGVQKNGHDTITVNLWPKPELTINSLVLGEKSINKGVAIEYDKPTKSKPSDLACFNGDKINLSYTVVGGQTESENQWSIKVNSGTEEYMPYTPGTSIRPLTVIKPFEPTTSTLSNKNTYTIVFSQDYKGNNYTSNKKWFTETYVINATAWRNSSLTTNLKDSIAHRSWSNSMNAPVDVYAGGYEINKVKFDISKHDGYTDGWNYDWQLNNIPVSTDYNTYTYIPSTSQDSELKTVTAHITNKIGNNYDCDETYTYRMRVWHKADIAESFSIVDNSQSRELVDHYLAVRDENVVTVSVPPMKFGYANNISDDYKYHWWDNGVLRTNSSDYTWNKTFDESYSKKDEFGSVEKSISMKLNNYGPYGHIWDGTPMKTVNFVVYNRPQTPTSLVKKGNGTSGTMICTTTIKDEELDNHDYFLVFGYKDAAGIEHEMARKQQRNPGEVRWDNSFKSYEVDNLSNRFYVYAEWVDQSGVIITSGRRYADGIEDKKWDGSVYTKTTRSEIRGFLAGDEESDATGIEEIPIAEDETEVSLVGIYDLNGRLVANRNVSLQPGMYIFKYENAGAVTAKKVCVK